MDFTRKKGFLRPTGCKRAWRCFPVTSSPPRLPPPLPLPLPLPSTRDLCKTVDGEAAFAVRFDTRLKIPAWTAHKLTTAHVDAIDTAPAYARRKDFFAPDPDLALNQQTTAKAYQGSGFDRGHMVRAQDMNWNDAAYRASFLMTNMVPQKHALNSGPWLGLEKAFQGWVRDKRITLWSLSGVYGAATDTAPGRPSVPSCFYKIIVAQTTDAQGNPAFKALAALFANDDHDTGQKSWIRHVTTLERIAANTGIAFLDGLNVEPGHDAAFWGVDMPAPPADCR